MVNEIITAAFEDELEKIAKIPRAVLEGGGGEIGALMRRKAAPGAAIAREKATYLKDLDRHFQKRVKGRHLNPAMPLPQTSAYDKYMTRTVPDPFLSGNMVSEAGLRKMDLEAELLRRGTTRLGDYNKSRRPLAGLGDPKVSQFRRPGISDYAEKKKGKVVPFPSSRSAAAPKSRREKIDALRQRIDDRDRQFVDDLFIDVDEHF